MFYYNFHFYHLFFYSSSKNSDFFFWPPKKKLTSRVLLILKDLSSLTSGDIFQNLQLRRRKLLFRFPKYLPSFLLHVSFMRFWVFCPDYNTINPKLISKLLNGNSRCHHRQVLRNTPLSFKTTQWDFFFKTQLHKSIITPKQYQLRKHDKSHPQCYTIRAVNH